MVLLDHHRILRSIEQGNRIRNMRSYCNQQIYRELREVEVLVYQLKCAFNGGLVVPEEILPFGIGYVIDNVVDLLVCLNNRVRS